MQIVASSVSVPMMMPMHTIAANIPGLDSSWKYFGVAPESLGSDWMDGNSAAAPFGVRCWTRGVVSRLEVAHMVRVVQL